MSPVIKRPLEVRPEYQFLVAGATGGFLPYITIALAIGSKHDALAVGRPGRGGVISRVECQPPISSAHEIEQPNVARPGGGVSLAHRQVRPSADKAGLL
jgi:hypothetical protein